MNSANCCKSYKLIFMDVEMPGENGMETTRKLKEM
jgi:CheY-like chemotaxis protein